MRVTVFTRLNAAASDRRLSHAHFRLFYAITQRQTTKLKSQPAIAKYLGIDERRVRRLIDDLVDFGYLMVKEGRGSGQSNEYSFPEKGVYTPSFEGEERGHIDPLSQDPKGGKIKQKKGGKIEHEKGVVGAPSYNTFYRKEEPPLSRKALRARGGRRLSEVELKLREDVLEREARRTASLTAAERKKYYDEIFYMVISPWREKNGRIAAGQFKEAKKLVRHLCSSGAAHPAEILIQNYVPMPNPLPDLVEYLRSFDRDRGRANGETIQ